MQWAVNIQRLMRISSVTFHTVQRPPISWWWNSWYLEKWILLEKTFTTTITPTVMSNPVHDSTNPILVFQKIQLRYKLLTTTSHSTNSWKKTQSDDMHPATQYVSKVHPTISTLTLPCIWSLSAIPWCDLCLCITGWGYTTLGNHWSQVPILIK